ncbi:unnamed protein product [Ambrosiozyma monospora]|uniref:Unnamed protein product n=1 Tax=Ambrosiozyma monospora TaxID=43982 RepID=A0A9W6T7X8_AMBMO|nr:unnamed protein product [Ambrosiozyma monospora]
MQFLIYSTLYVCSLGVVSFNALYAIFGTGTVDEDYFSLHIMFVSLLCVVFGICVGIFMLFTLYQLLKNKTTLESYEFQRYEGNGTSTSVGNVYNLGYRKNWSAVMGKNWYEWVLPIRVTSNYLNNDGLGFEVNKDIYNTIRANERLQQRLSNELHNYRNNQKRMQHDDVQDILNDNSNYFG